MRWSFAAFASGTIARRSGRDWTPSQGGFAAAPESAQRLATFKSHTVLCCELIDWVVEHQIPGTFAFDSYFTNAPICNHIAGHARAYVGDLKFNRKVWFRGTELRAEEMAAQIPVGRPQEGDASGSARSGTSPRRSGCPTTLMPCGS